MAEDKITTLSKAASKWQKLLKLDEWKIGVGLSSKEKMKGQTGIIDYSREKGQALITLLNKEENDTFSFPYNEEDTLVRKMLDLRFEMISCEGEERIYFERTLRIIAELLVALDRRNTILQPQAIQQTEQTANKQMPRVINV